MADIRPNKTIYCQNLYEKIRSKEQMKKCLYAIFSQFGRILDVVVMKSHRLRGQAWVAFEEQASATAALRAMQGFPFYDKPMRLSYAKEVSDAHAKLEPGYKPLTKEQKEARAAKSREEHLNRQKGGRKAANGLAQAPVAMDTSNDVTPPNRILFVENLPAASTAEMLSMLFKQFTGFREVRLVAARPGIAFVEYESEAQSSVALSGLQNFAITPQNTMRITYAKQ